jgi:hypothetical protein
MTISITPAMVEETIRHMQRKATGPDGLDFLFFQAFPQQLSAILAPCLTRVVRHGLPPDSPLRRGQTLLFYKPQSRVFASDPSQYRPITLLPMTIRVLHKLLDLLFRGVPVNPDADPDEQRAFPPPPPWPFHDVQSAFQPRRNAHEQAFLFHQLQANVRDHHTRGSPPSPSMQPSWICPRHMTAWSTASSSSTS